jgi:hypothetical protein
MRKSWIALITAMCIANLGVALTACASNCSVADSSTSTPSGRQTVEFPSGPIDGNNQSFGLSGPPLEGTEVTIYENGEVVSSIASAHVGKGNTFMLTSPPRPGLVLLASYCKAAYTAASSSTAPTVPITSIARQALLEAVVRKSTLSQESVLANSPGRIQEVSPAVATTAQRNNAAFMSMLSRSLQLHDEDTRFSRVSTKAAETGYEGTGDRPLAPSYSTQMGHRVIEPLLVTSQPSSTSGMITDALPRSLRLLQQRFIEADDENQVPTWRRKH